jgi:hypothetical protein
LKGSPTHTSQFIHSAESKNMLTSDVCLQAAFNPSSVQINVLKSICTLAYGRLWQDEQEDSRAKKLSAQQLPTTRKGAPCQCGCGAKLIQSPETGSHEICHCTHKVGWDVCHKKYKFTYFYYCPSCGKLRASAARRRHAS